MNVFIPFMVLSNTVFYHYAQGSSICSYKKEIYPCRCNLRGFNGLLCDKITDVDLLWKPLQTASDHNIRELSLQFSRFETLPVQIVNFMGFKYLKVKFLKLSSLFDDVLYGRIELEQLQMDGITTIHPIVWTPLESFMDLKRFSVSNMEIDNIDENLMKPLTKSLQSFSITATNTKEIAPAAFAELRELVYISIQKTNIAILRRSMFPSPAKIRFFYFGSNKISSLPSDLFEDMPQLQRIGLKDNFIAEIKHSTFAPIWNNLSTLLFSGNPLKCYCSMSWITEIKAPVVLTGRCQVPKDKYGKALWKLNHLDFNCTKEEKH